MKAIIAVPLCAALAVSLSACGGNLFKTRADLVASPSPCSTKRFEVYFDEGQARLTQSARQAIGMAASQLQGCSIRKVSVLGLADASGGADANMNLSQARAQAVAEALTGAGWPAPAFEVAAAGDAGATTPSGAQEPLRRRTEVLVEAAPR